MIFSKENRERRKGCIEIHEELQVEGRVVAHEWKNVFCVYRPSKRIAWQDQ